MSNCSKYDCVLKFTILAKSIVKDKYIRSFSFILDMGQKSVITIGTPRVYPVNSKVNMSCNIECCGNKMCQTVPNTIVS